MFETIQNSIKVRQLDIKPDEILKYISLTGNPDEKYFLDILDPLLDSLGDEDVLFAYSVIPSSMEDRSLNIDNTIFNVGNDISRMIRSVEKTVVFVCTVSPGLKDKLEEYNFNENYIEAYLSDIIGTVIVGKAVEKLNKTIKEEYSSYKVTNTISPGNCSLPVEEQNKLLNLLPEGVLNIKINSSGMMYPVKSLSGIIGIGQNVKYLQTECRYCKSRNCLYRKEEYIYI